MHLYTVLQYLIRFQTVLVILWSVSVVMDWCGAIGISAREVSVPA